MLLTGVVGTVSAIRRLSRAARRVRTGVAQLAARARRGTPGGLTAVPGGGLTAALGGRLLPPVLLPVSARWPQPGAGFLARARLAVAVRGATDAVTQAAAAGAPVGELPGLLRRLRVVSARADAALRAGGRDCARAEALVTQATALSRRIRQEAGAAAATVTQHELTGLAVDIGDAVHGLHAAATWLAGTPPTAPPAPVERASAPPAASGPLAH